MGIILILADLILLLAVVISGSRAVRNGLSRGVGSLLLSVFATLAMLVFALVSFIAAWGLARSASIIAQAVLLLFLVAIAIITRVLWVSRA